MGLGYTLFGKPIGTLAAVFAALSGLYLLPEYWPDHAIAADAIRRDDGETLGRYLARGLDPDDRAQWRSYPRRTLGRATREGVGNDTPDLGGADEPLLAFAMGTCKTARAFQLVDAGADVAVRDRSGSSALQRAASCGDQALVAALLAKGADPNAEEPDGGTVLWEPTNLGWKRRPFDERSIAALERAGAARPARAAIRR
jgi:hypothetical protein